MPDKLITPTDLRNIARQLLHNGKMPSPQVFAEVMAKVREEYVPAARKLREQQKEK
jgi:cytochrome c-type biogenesis protein CcmE